MSPRCPNCGYEGAMESSPMGRPKKLDDAKIKALHKGTKTKRGLSLSELAMMFGVTRGAIQKALKR